MIVHAIDDAKSELLVQAYGFTSGPIIQAVARAKERGVNVRVILDKINEQKRYTAATYLKNHGIDPMIDFQPAIAHNKVMVIDRGAWNCSATHRCLTPEIGGKIW